MKRCVCSVLALAALFLSNVAYAGRTQVSGDKFKAAGTSGHYYGRSDGVYQNATTKSPSMIENGQQVAQLGKGFYHDFSVYADGEGIACADAGAFGDCGGNTTLVPCVCQLADGGSFIWMPLVTADTVPDMDAGSLDIASDQTDNDGAQLIWGLPGASGKPFVIGRDPAFYMCTKFALSGTTTTTVSGIDNNIMAGFVGLTNDAWNADYAALDIYAGIGVEGTAASGLTLEDIYIHTETDAALDGTGDGITSTDTTDSCTENTTTTLCTYVSATGVVTYTIGGSAPTTTATFTFVDGVTVVPFLTFLNTADLADEIDIYSVKVGYRD